VVGFTAIAGVGSVAGAYVRYGWSLTATLAVAVAVQSAALWWRRRYPLAVLLVIVVVELGAIVSTPDREPGGVALAFAVYAVSVYGPPRLRLIVAASAIAVILVAVVVLILGYFPAARVLIPSGAFSLVAWVIGDYIRNRRAFFHDLVERHRHERDLAAEEERLRIARELHDVVAHNVSVIAIQAGAARVSGSSSPEALATIEQSARDTLAELNKLLGVLRKNETGADRAPQPTLDDVDALLKPARDAGLRATLKVNGDKRRLSAALDLSAYRIVQEAITNVLKHANASRVEVVIDYEKEGIALTVSDNGSGPSDGQAGGHGLIGMRERVALFGGKMGTGTMPLGGFTLHARLPYKS
jgi:signal transduction histidine kinase